mmetsp:Transcript_13026/g.25237  ORF Transcript_13026/g.25237 Transcript_13026/m.25237 type:complete len:448 (+) Transcript_13026:46-1389(+)
MADYAPPPPDSGRSISSDFLYTPDPSQEVGSYGNGGYFYSQPSQASPQSHSFPKKHQHQQPQTNFEALPRSQEQNHQQDERKFNGSAEKPTAWGGANEEDLRREAEVIFIQKIENKCKRLMEKNKNMEAIALLEESLPSRLRVFGRNGDPYITAVEKLIHLYNSVAMASLYKENYDLTLDLLDRACNATAKCHRKSLSNAKVQTLNNLACCYRRMKKPRLALKILRQSLDVLHESRITEGRAVTHLNMCAILSQLNNHKDALSHAKAAVLHCQKQLLSDEYRDALSQGADQSNKLTEQIIVLGIAYHNLGVEEEFLHNYEACLQWYGKALHLAKEHVGNKQEITKTFRASYQQAKRTIQQKEEKKQSMRSSSSSGSLFRDAGISRSRTNSRPQRPASAGGNLHSRSTRSSSSTNDSRKLSRKKSNGSKLNSKPMHRSGSARSSMRRH